MPRAMRFHAALASCLAGALLGAPGAAVAATDATADSGAPDASAATTGAVAAQAAQRPVYQDGHTGRTLLGGTWRMRVDRGDRGLAGHWERSRSTAGWKPVRIPNAYNVGENTREGLIGWPAWYRKDFTLPAGSRSVSWRVRFEAVNYRATVWLNGRRIGEHAGAFEPFELALAGARPGRVNRLVVRVDNRRLPTDFPPSRYTATDQPRGGWWNYGGLVREVYLRRVDRVDVDSVQVMPRLGCATCPATVRFRVGVRNDSNAPQRVRLTGRFGTLPVSFAARTLRPGRIGTFAASVRVARPRLWSPRDPYLHRVRLDVSAQARGGRPTPAAGYRLHSGLRSVGVDRNGRLTLNGRPVNLRGVSLHEDLPGKGAALTSDDHAETVARIKDVGATLVRSHYPLHPVFHEMADRNGLLIWSEVPVYQMREEAMEPAAVRREAVEHLTSNIVTNQNHPSVITWSVGNELDETVPRPVRAYIAQAAAAARRIDSSRPVSYALAGHPRVACRPGYEPLDLIGINDYFGWYTSADIVNREDLSGYLDTMRRCYPDKALMITEFGAEANRSGPVEEKGTYEFQRDFIRYHLGVFAAKPWLSGAAYWTLREFLIHPDWAGGNPLPTPPMHQKGVIAYDGSLKPAYADLRDAYRATEQLP